MGGGGGAPGGGGGIGDMDAEGCVRYNKHLCETPIKMAEIFVSVANYTRTRCFPLSSGIATRCNVQLNQECQINNYMMGNKGLKSNAHIGHLTVLQVASS